MRKKRLQHIADTLCHMFCGWQTFWDYNELVRLGSGELKVVMPQGDCFFNGQPITPLKITKALKSWMEEDCRANNIDISGIISSELVVKMEFTTIAGNERKHSEGEMFAVQGKPIEPEKWHRCEFSCSSVLKTDEKEYMSKHTRIREWPYGWPEPTKSSA